MLAFSIGAFAAGCTSNTANLKAVDQGPAQATATSPTDGASPSSAPTALPPSIETKAAAPVANDCTLRAEVTARHSVQVAGLTELSGLAATGLDEATLWGHNDHGNSAQILALDTDGRAISWWPVAAQNVDWEDIAIRRTSAPEQIVIADIGDNDEDRSSVSLLYVDVPTGEAKNGALQPRVVELRYPDGPRNAEALLIHPITGEAIIVSKTNGPARVYTTQGDPLALDAPALHYVVSVQVDGKVLAGDMSPDGELVALRTKGSVYVWVSRPDGLQATFEGRPCRFDLDQHKPEALAFQSNTTLVLSGEGPNPDLIDIALSPEATD